MVKIEFKLPFKLPIKDNTIIVSAYSVGDIKVSFKQETRTFRFLDNQQDNLYEFTIALVEYSHNSSLEDINDIFHYAVVNSIQYINRFIDALRFKLGIRELNNFTITDLQERIQIEYKNKRYSYVTNPISASEDSLEASKEDVAIALRILKKWDEFPCIEVVDKFYEKAKHHLAKEDFIFAIIELQTSFEAFIRNTHRLILKKNNATEDEIEKAHKIAFRNVIEHHLANALKVNLSFIEPGLIKKWYDNLYILRNQIVHSGQSFISGDTAYEAYDSYVEARNYISELLVIEGYLSEDGKADLSLFVKNSRRNEEEEKLLYQRLIEKGLVSADIPLIKKSLS